MRSRRFISFYQLRSQRDVFISQVLASAPQQLVRMWRGARGSRSSGHCFVLGH